MVEKETEKKTEGLLPKLLSILTSFIGCVTLLVAPFYTPFTNLLGAIGTILFSFFVQCLLIYAAFSGFEYTLKLLEKEKTPKSFCLIIYMVSMFSMLTSVLLFARIVSWTFSHSFGIKIDWLNMPQ